MTPFDPNDPMLRQLRRLPSMAADAGRSRLVRDRCVAIAARRQRALSARGRMDDRRRRVESTLVGVFCVAYVAAVLFDVARLMVLR